MRVMYRKDLEKAKETLEKGGILGVPTETVYGLAVKSDNAIAIKKLLTLKERPVGSGKVLTMMLADVNDIPKYALVDYEQLTMARHYFPGELTILLPKRRSFKHPYFDSFDTIGIRIPAHDYMLELLNETGPLLVTSANPRGERPCRDYKELRQRMPSVDAVVQGTSGGNIPSTVVDWTDKKPRVVRQGGLLIVRYA
ncbi:threonylcarbamoyl-AMP synthase [Candidatus Saccharibacteria bacterium]|nr:threonylcarbamoyl-AMP synthase [Candidatus Saccharibacteria bacterium]